MSTDQTCCPVCFTCRCGASLAGRAGIASMGKHCHGAGAKSDCSLPEKLDCCYNARRMADNYCLGHTQCL